jgi:hypothetical protein
LIEKTKQNIFFSFKLELPLIAANKKMRIDGDMYRDKE